MTNQQTQDGEYWFNPNAYGVGTRTVDFKQAAISSFLSALQSATQADERRVEKEIEESLRKQGKTLDWNTPVRREVLYESDQNPYGLVRLILKDRHWFLTIFGETIYGPWHRVRLGFREVTTFWNILPAFAQVAGERFPEFKEHCKFFMAQAPE